MTGREFENAVIELAETLGYLVHHQRPGLMANGEWRSAISGDKGFPDLVLAGRGRVIFAELKAGTGRLSPEQAAWVGRLSTAGFEAYVWHPEQLDAIATHLQKYATVQITVAASANPLPKT